MLRKMTFMSITPYFINNKYNHAYSTYMYIYMGMKHLIEMRSFTGIFHHHLRVSVIMTKLVDNNVYPLRPPIKLFCSRI